MTCRGCVLWVIGFIALALSIYMIPLYKGVLEAPDDDAAPAGIAFILIWAWVWPLTGCIFALWALCMYSTLEPFDLFTAVLEIVLAGVVVLALLLFTYWSKSFVILFRWSEMLELIKYNLHFFALAFGPQTLLTLLTVAALVRLVYQVYLVFFR